MTEKKTDPILKNIFIVGMSNWQKNVQIPSSEYPPHYQQLIQEQNNVGWQQMWNGRWTTQWRKLQDIHCTLMNEKELTGHEWALKLLLSVWQSWNDLWSKRNEIVHGDSHGEKVNIF